MSKIISTTGEGTVVDILLGNVGAVLGGWLLNLIGGTGVTGFNTDSVYSASIAAIGAIIRAPAGSKTIIDIGTPNREDKEIR